MKKNAVRGAHATLAVALAAVTILFTPAFCAEHLAADGLIADAWEYERIDTLRVVCGALGLAFAYLSFRPRAISRMIRECRFAPYSLFSTFASSALVLLSIATLGCGPIQAAFDVTGEYNLPALWSALLFTVPAAVIFRHSAENRWLWWSVGGLLIFAALDELLSIHECAGMALSSLTGAHLVNRSHLWIAIYAPLLLIAAWIILTRLGSEIREHRSSFAWILAGGAVFCAGAIALEFVEMLESQRGALIIPGRVYFEEYLEMLGCILAGTGVLHLFHRKTHRGLARDAGAGALRLQPR